MAGVEQKMLVASDLDPEVQGSESDAAETGVSRRRMVAKMGVVATVVCGAALVITLTASGRGAPASTSMGAVTSGLSMKASFASTLATAAAKTSAETSAAAKTSAAQLDTTGTSEYGAASIDKVADSSLAPKENMNDGSLCGVDEEDFETKCFKKCSMLTSGAAPYRCSAWSCSSSTDCSLLHTKLNVGMCDGYDVAGDAEGKGECPHKHGLCLEDEELFGELCYMACNKLTGGKYPYRKTAFTCCKQNSVLPCLSYVNTDTNSAYNCGGGNKDGDKNTPSAPHPPLKSLAEAGATDVSTTPPQASAPPAASAPAPATASDAATTPAAATEPAAATAPAPAAPASPSAPSAPVQSVTTPGR